MPSYLDFDSTKKFRDYILGKTLQVPNGPQTFTNSSYSNQNLNVLSNVNPGAVDDNRSSELVQTSNSNVYKPTEFFIKDTLDTLPRRANLNLYPYFVQGNYNLIGLMMTSNYDTESELMKFAASNIQNNPQGPVQSRIAQNLDRTLNGSVRLLDALNGNTATAMNIITGREPLIEANNQITVAKTLPGKAIDFLQTVAGVEFPFSEIPGDYLSNPSNPINYRPVASTELGRVWQDVTGALGSLIGIQRRPKLSRKPSDLMIEYMGQGQKNRLYDALSFSKYAPNYTTTARSQNTSKIFNFVDKAAQGVKNLLGAEAPAGRSYIGDDRGNDVKYAMSDFNDRPVRSSYYLSLMFDKVSAELFHKSKNITEGGSIGGKLNWISKNSKNKIGSGNNEWSSESTLFEDALSTRFQFREDSILGHTQAILDSMPSDGGAARSHVANVIDQTSRVFGDGDTMISRGSAVKYTNKFSGEESGVEYCRVWTKDRGYMNYSDTMKRTGNIRKFDGSVMGGGSRPWNLNMGPMSNGNKSFEGSTNIFDKYNFGGGFYAKKYMFSIENLAWKTSSADGFKVTDLPVCERGPNGGRVMWFPPYDLKIQENNSAKWEENIFLGRPEPIYTYQNTSRTGTLSFKVVVDHPSILNLLVREHFKGMSDEESDNYINAFFAGCQDVDFYELIKTYTTLDSDDVNRIQAYLNSGPKKPDEIKKFKYVTEQVETSPKTEESAKVEQPAPYEGIVYFPNDYPIKNGKDDTTADAPYVTIKNLFYGQKSDYISDLNDNLSSLRSDANSANPSNSVISDVKTIFSVKKVSDYTSDYVAKNTKVVESVTKGFEDLNTNYTNLVKTLTTLKKDITEKIVNKVEIKIMTSTSEVADDNYNFYLGMRRANAIVKDILTNINNGGDINKALKWPTPEQLKKLKLEGLFNGEIIVDFKDLGYKDVNGGISFTITTHGENTKLEGPNGLNCKQVIKTKYKGSKNRGLKDTAPVAFFCRQSSIKLKYQRLPKAPTKEPVKIPKITIQPDDSPTTGGPRKPSIDVMKRIIMKTLTECFYFKKLEEDSPLAFNSLKEKLKYFHPGFHSTTPEGLNSRLTFLLQCLRPGDTIPIKGLADTTDIGARNTTFGPPPICVLRIGDFYHSKVVIKDVNFTYNDSTWDMNPEGIGVQPMIADVTVQLAFIGGQGLERPVERLQNALSSNFFANTEMYDERAQSTATTIDGKSTEDFTKAFLEDLQKKPSFVEKTDPDLNKSTISEGQFMGKFTPGTSDTDKGKVGYSDAINMIYSTTGQYFNVYQSAYNEVIKKYGLKIGSLFFHDDYRKIKDLNVYNGPTATKIQILGQYEGGKNLDYYSRILRASLLTAVDSSDLTTLLGIKSELSSDSSVVNSNNLLKPFIKNLITESIGKLNEVPSIKTLESVRNEMISAFDKVNYVNQYGHDVTVSGTTGSTYSLSGFTYDKLYNEYSSVVEYITKQNGDFKEDLNVSLDFNSPNITDNILSELLSILLQGEKDNIVKLYEKDTTVFPDNVRTNIGKKINDFITTTKEKKFKLGKFPIRKNENAIEFNVDTITVMGNDDLEEKKVAVKIFNSKVKLDKDTLNFYKP